MPQYLCVARRHASLIVAGIKRTRKSKYFNATAHTAFCGNCSVSLSWTGGSSVAVYTRINYPGCANVIYTVRGLLIDRPDRSQLDGHDTLAVQCRGADDAFRQRVFVACVRPGFVLANDTQQ